MESYKAIRDLLDTYILEGFQTVDLITCLAVKKAIIMYDTGMGKTILSSAIMKALRNERGNRRFIFIGKKTQIPQTPKDIERATGFRVMTVSAAMQDVQTKLFSRNFTKYEVLFMTFEALNNPVIMNVLYKHKEYYDAIFVDEAHEVSNFQESSSAWMLRAMLRNFDYRFALTATPMVTKIEQSANLAHMFDWERFDNIKDLVHRVKKGDSLVEIAPDFFINRTRKELGIVSNYRTHIVMTEPHEHQVGQEGLGMTSITKGNGAENQAMELRDLVLSNIERRGLIYIRQHAVREWVLPFLDSAGIRYDCIHGNVGLDKRARIMEDFANGKLDVVITSVTTSLNLDCDYIIFYEFCPDIKQMMGRAQRGLNPKTLDLYFIFTRKTGEIEYFLTYYYKRSLTVQQVLKKDYGELISAGKELESSY